MNAKSLLLLILTSFSALVFSQDEKKVINKLIDNWHKAAADADQKLYFEYIEDNGIFIGTDATENWNKEAFFEWSKPYFERGKTWIFVAKERNIYFSDDKKLAWFDEQLEYPGGDLRGSGVLTKKIDGWKIKHYVLSLPVPNEKYKAVLEVINDKQKNTEPTEE